MAWLDETRRVWALTLATAVVASGVGLGVALIGGGDDDGPESTPSPIATGTVEPTAPATPAITGSPAPSPTASPASATATPAKTAPPTQDAASVDCDQTPTLCSSSTGRMVVADGKVGTNGKTDHGTNYTTVPRTTMTWQFLKGDGTQADTGEEIESLRVSVVIENGTSDRTFVFPRREVVLQLRRDGNAISTAPSRGEVLELPPGGSFQTTFTQPITTDGTYDWRGKTWFYQK